MSKVPTVRQTSWVSIIPHLIVIIIIMLIWNLIIPQKTLLYGALTYLIISISLRNLVPKDHRNGIKKNNSGNFKEAIADFQKSYDFFTKHEWIDKYRFVTLLSSSKISYREMALVNIAFCYSQLGNGIKAKEYYERTLNEFPKSELAKSALKLITSIEESTLQQQ